MTTEFHLSSTVNHSNVATLELRGINNNSITQYQIFLY